VPQVQSGLTDSNVSCKSRTPNDQVKQVPRVRAVQSSCLAARTGA
jgi:hypothetical protein